MNHNNHSEMRQKIFALLVIILFLNLPIVTALEISNVNIASVSPTGVNIQWSTDQAADSFVHYGKDASSLKIVGDANSVTNHALQISGLTPSTKYLYSVESSSTINDNDGKLYSFETPAPDITPPTINVKIPELNPGAHLQLSGETEIGAKVEITINGKIGGSVTAIPQVEDKTKGNFTFSDLVLQENSNNILALTATDAAGNKATAQGTIFADTTKPTIDLKDLPSLIAENSYQLKKTISEDVHYEIFVNDKSVSKGDGKTIDVSLPLKDGPNTIKVVLQDKAGLSSQQEAQIESDSKPPTLKAELTRGKEYYEGRASSPISGTTKPGAKIYLYVYRPLPTEFTPTFDRPRATTTANDKGEFNFDDISFSSTIADISLQKVMPKELPPELVKIKISPVVATASEQETTYFIYLIAEDKTGKTVSWQQQVLVKSCFSGNVDFSVESMPEFQAPLRLVPQLVDSGRQDVQAVFKLVYNGQGLATRNAAGEITEKGARVSDIVIKKACTQGMLKDEKFNLGCKLLPEQPKPLPNADKSAVYATWILHPGQDFSNGKEDFWNEFKKRQIVFPLKIQISYQDVESRDAQGSPVYGVQKTQTSCTDLSYFVDIPLDSKKMIPDFLANQGVDALNWTITQIGTVTPYIQQAYLVTAFTGMASFMLRTVARWVRVFTSKLEYYFSQVKTLMSDEKRKEEGCPADSGTLYLDDTLNDWKDHQIKNIPKDVQAAIESNDPASAAWKKVSLESRCPNTANAWKFEAVMDQAYKWSWDRAFCRAVPARWTEDKDLDKINSVILSQQQCGVSGQCGTLTKRENCYDELIKPNKLNIQSNLPSGMKESDVTLCWLDGNSNLYLEKPHASLMTTEKDDADNGFVRFLWIANLYSVTSVPRSPDIIVYRPQGAEDICVAKDNTCTRECSKKPGYRADTEKGNSNGCYTQKADGTLVAKNGEIRVEDRVAAGYTRDCFIQKTGEASIQLKELNKDLDNLNVQIAKAKEEVAGAANDKDKKAAAQLKVAGLNTDLAQLNVALENAKTTAAEKPEEEIAHDSQSGKPILQQCVCMKDTGTTGTLKDSSDFSMRVATAKNTESGKQEAWSYQQSQVYSESNHRIGTYYPTERYYSGRDFSGAFGANYLIDYLRSQEKEAQVNPNTQIIGAFQSVCLSGILKNLKLLQSMLAGIQACLIEAKYTGLHDAGMCKTLFTEQVCGLMYQGIAYLANSCVPEDLSKQGKEGSIADIGKVLSGGFSAMSEAVDSSFKDAVADYGNPALNQYFKGGVQGFSQSICLAAFGYDFPLFSQDVLLDAAYSFPTKSFPVVAPATRELSSYDPTKQMAIFNYNIGAVIFPGCKIKSWSMKLKCIGPADNGNPNVDLSCGGKGCDCLNSPGTGAAFEAQKEQLITNGFNLPPAQMFSVPLESPQRFTAPFRYDHVVVELTLDPSVKGSENKCIESDYLQGNKGVFYFPITDISPPNALSCHVDAASGRYVCPELYSLFGYGGAYLEDPYVSCWNKKTETWMPCDTPNLFVLNDEIKVRAHVNSDGKGQCLKRTVSPSVPGIETEGATRPILQNVPGEQFVPEVLGIVNDAMFGGSAPILIRAGGGSNNCPERPEAVHSPTELTTGDTFTFGFDTASSDDKVKLRVPSNVNIASAGYGLSGSYLAHGTDIELTVADINTVQFSAKDFIFKNVLGGVNPSDTNKQCTYQAIPQNTYTQNQNYRDFTVTYELLERDEGGSCALANQPVKTSLGKATHTQKIRIQKQETAVSGLQQSFGNGNYQQTQEYAITVLNQRRGDIENALAYYYYIASFVMLGKKDPQQYAVQIKDSLSGFFTRQWASQKAADYPADVKAVGEYQKIEKYLCEVDGKYEGVNGGYCGGSVSVGGGNGDSSNKCSSSDYPINDLAGDNAKYAYRCDTQKANSAYSCLKSTGQPPSGVSQPFTFTDTDLLARCSGGGAGADQCKSVGFTLDIGDEYLHMCVSATEAYSCDPKTGSAVKQYLIADVKNTAQKQKLLEACKNS